MLAVILLVMSKSGGGMIGGAKTSIGGDARLTGGGGDSSGCSTTDTGAVDALLSFITLLTASCQGQKKSFDRNRFILIWFKTKIGLLLRSHKIRNYYTKLKLCKNLLTNIYFSHPLNQIVKNFSLTFLKTLVNLRFIRIII